MKRKVILLTGATSGIGKAMAVGLASGGASVTIVARNEAKGKRAVLDIQEKSGSDDLQYLTADLSSQASVRALAEKALSTMPGLNLLMNNAGGYYPQRRLSADRIEMTFAVNHLAPFLLTEMLLPRLKANAPSRIVNTASTAHKMGRIAFDDLGGSAGYGGFRAYSQSKLANVLFTYALARRLEKGKDRVTANCFHPGVVRSGLWHQSGAATLIAVLGYPFMISAEKGARTGIYLAMSPEVDHVSGDYFVRSRAKPSSPGSRDRETQERLWKVSAELCGLPAEES